MTISVFMAVFNEENRIRYTLESLKWCDEIVIVDKTSTDKTVEICKEYGAKVNIIPNSDTYDPREHRFMRQCTGDWIMLMTASDIIDKSLAMEIKHQMEILPDNIKCIKVPFRNYILGISDRRSPWDEAFRSKVFRRDNYKIDNDVHAAFHILDETAYTIPEEFGYFSHLTHVSVDMLLDRHMRYWRGEGRMYDKDSLDPAFNDILSSIDLALHQIRTYKIGWDGVALTMAFVSYSMFSFLYKWEHLNKQKAKDIYHKLREANFKSWNEDSQSQPLPECSGQPETTPAPEPEFTKEFDFFYYYRKDRRYKRIFDFALKIVRKWDKMRK